MVAYRAGSGYPGAAKPDIGSATRPWKRQTPPPRPTRGRMRERRQVEAGDAGLPFARSRRQPGISREDRRRRRSFSVLRQIRCL